MTTLNIEADPKALLCDVCSAPNPHWDYDTGEDIVQEAWVESGPKLGPDLIYDHLWVLCDACHEFAGRGDFRGLLLRAWAAYLIARPGLPTEAVEISRKLIASLYGKLKEQGFRRCYWCSTCKRVSYNLTDIEHRYCGNCHKFEGDKHE